MGCRRGRLLLFSACAHAVLLPLSGAELGGWPVACPRPRTSARFGLVFSWTFYGVLAAFPRARPCGRQRIPSPAPRCQLASQRLAPLGPCRAGVHLCCLSLVCGFGFLRSVINAVGFCVLGLCGVACCCFRLGLFLLCFIFLPALYLYLKKSYLYHISKYAQMFIKTFKFNKNINWIPNMFFKYRNRVMNYYLLNL